MGEGGKRLWKEERGKESQVVSHNMAPSSVEVEVLLLPSTHSNALLIWRRSSMMLGVYVNHGFGGVQFLQRLLV